MIAVWGRTVRILHWSLVLTVAAAWLTRHSRGSWHEWLGYATLAIVVARTIWGFAASGYTRFADFVRPASVTAAYARTVFAGREARFLGHNPLGGWMVVALLATVTAVGATGWMYSLDMFWGLAWVEWLHRTLAWTLVALIALHLAGVAFTSWRHRENLVAAMLSGRKRPEEPGDIA
jgi:cytochrome b